MLAKELAEKATDIVRSYLEGKLSPVLSEISNFKNSLDEKANKAEVETTLRDALKAYAPLDLALFESRLGEVKAAIPEAVKGDPGKDAEPLEFVVASPEQESYPVGTHAAFNGGLWKATELTEGLKGWECLVDGVKETRIEPTEDPRTFIAKTVFASGNVQESKMYVPAIIYKGVYENGSAYTTGDTVTYKGSLWHCNEPTEVSPGDGKAWTLAVKRGQDAKGS